MARLKIWRLTGVRSRMLAWAMLASTLFLGAAGVAQAGVCDAKFMHEGGAVQLTGSGNIALGADLAFTEVTKSNGDNVAEGADGAGMTRSIPIEKCLDDVLVAFSQNGERLRPEQGYPIRLFVPGFEGNMSIKWLRRLHVTDQPGHTREETAKYTDLMADGRAREAGFSVHAEDGRVFATANAPILGTGFLRGGGAQLIRPCFDWTPDGRPVLSAHDESTLMPGLFLAGPQVRQDRRIYCFIYKFRQRFDSVAVRGGLSPDRSAAEFAGSAGQHPRHARRAAGRLPGGRRHGAEPR